MDSVLARPFMGYMVSRCGRVFRKGKELKPQVKNSGYLYLYLYQSGIRKRFYLHRIIGKVHLKKPRNRLRKYINHKDGNKMNCHYLNIEWVTASENLLHAYRIGLRGKNSGKPFPGPIQGIDNNLRVCA